MSLKAIKGLRGEDQAFCSCDACGAELTIKARHGDRLGYRPGKSRHGIPVMSLRSEPEVIRDLEKIGWSSVKGRLRCPACEAKRIEKTRAEAGKVIEMATKVETKPAAVREASGPQKRLIILALEDAYDDGAKRYKGAATDASVAQGLGDGIMPGWVSAIREEMFGPAGNEEIEAIKREIAAMVESANATAAAMLKRIEAVERASDRRVKG